MNWMCRRTTAVFLASLPEEFGGYSFECDLRDSISREVCFTGRYDPQETALLQAFLSEGMTFVDVGSNWGYFTLLAARFVGKSGRVISIEPHPRLFKVLQENVQRNRLQQVTALQLAAGSERGTCKLLSYEEALGNYGTSHLVRESKDAAHIFNVPMRPLDALFDELELKAIDLLKMDIEGAEGFALQGLVKSLSNFRIYRLILELHPAQLAEHGQAARDVIQLLSNLGYRAWTIDHSVSGTRHAAYVKRVDTRGLLQPFVSAKVLDVWPHLLWVMPELEPIP
jgi:FkbM family methyltransferase